MKTRKLNGVEWRVRKVAATMHECGQTRYLLALGDWRLRVVEFHHGEPATEAYSGEGDFPEDERAAPFRWEVESRSHPAVNCPGAWGRAAELGDAVTLCLVSYGLLTTDSEELAGKFMQRLLQRVR